MSAADAATMPTLGRVIEILDGLEVESYPTRDGMAAIEVSRAELHDVLERLRDRGHFETCTLVTAVDRYPAEPRFEVVHQLHSLAGGLGGNSERVRIKTLLSADDSELPTCVDLWPGARYMERECFDMFGVVFTGHDDLKRLLMPEEYDHHPLRKDFPHQGIEPDRLYREWDRKRRQGWSP